MKKITIIILIVFLFGSTEIAFAQFNTVDTQIEVSSIPENPGPNEEVQMSVVSYATNLNAAKITWKVNGKVIKSGIGQKIISFTTGDIGTKTSIEITILTSEGETIVKNFTINPATVDIVWQSKSYVPQFYKGKALFSHQNEIEFIAIPHILSSSGSEINPKNLIYQWKKDDKALESDSGYGKSTLKVTGSIISRPIKIEVIVTSPTSNNTAYSHTTIKPDEPLIIFYRKNPLYGIEFQKALVGDTNIDNIDEMNVIVMPFFFGVDYPKAPELAYKWSINGNNTQNQNYSNSQIFRKKEGVSGKSLISVTVENTEKVLQFTSGNFSLTFDNVKK